MLCIFDDQLGHGLFLQGKGNYYPFLVILLVYDTCEFVTKSEGIYDFFNKTIEGHVKSHAITNLFSFLIQEEVNCSFSSVQCCEFESIRKMTLTESTMHENRLIKTGQSVCELQQKYAPIPLLHDVYLPSGVPDHLILLNSTSEWLLSSTKHALKCFPIFPAQPLHLRLTISFLAMGSHPLYYPFPNSTTFCHFILGVMVRPWMKPHTVFCRGRSSAWKRELFMNMNKLFQKTVQPEPPTHMVTWVAVSWTLLRTFPKALLMVQDQNSEGNANAQNQ